MLWKILPIFILDDRQIRSGYSSEGLAARQPYKARAWWGSSKDARV